MKIKELILLTNSKDELKNFYSNILELEIINNGAGSFTVKTMFTDIIFKYTSEFKNPFYHFAINIPENQFKQAKDWVMKRLDLIKLNGENEFDFTNWNAHSVYFYDPAGNIVELIARHNLKNSSENIFSGKSLLSVSEIGLPVYDVKKFYDIVKKKISIPVFSGDMKSFTAAGDDEGLFIIVPDGRKWFPDCPDAKIFPTIVNIISYEEHNIVFDNIPYKIISIKG